MITLTLQDIKSIAQVSEHYDTDKLGIATNEALVFDLGSVFGTFIDEVETNWNDVGQHWRDLIDGSTFTKGERTVKHHGLKEVLKYYAYSRYVMINGFNDTPNGSVSKSNPFSVPKPLREIESFSLKYNRMGAQLLGLTLEYVCQNKELFTGFDASTCANSLQSSVVSSNGTAQVGFNSKTISKWDV